MKFLQNLQLPVFISACLIFLIGCGEDCPTYPSYGSRTFYVAEDGPYQTISEALDHARIRDRILVSPGTYRDSVVITFPVRIESRGEPGTAVLDGEGRHRCIFVDRAAGTDLVGLRIINGNSHDGGSGVRINDCYVLMKDCILEHNVTSEDGGALAVLGQETYVDIDNCSFTRNHADNSAGAIHVSSEATVNMYACRFIGNTSNLYAGAVACSRMGMVHIEDCLFHENASDSMVSAIYIYGAQATIVNNTFIDNSAPQYGSILLRSCRYTTNLANNIIAYEKLGYGLYALYSYGIDKSCNVFWGNAKGPIGGSEISMDPTDIVADPIFCNIENGDFRISSSSPASSEHNPSQEHIGAYEIGCD